MFCFFYISNHSFNFKICDMMILPNRVDYINVTFSVIILAIMYIFCIYYAFIL